MNYVILDLEWNGSFSKRHKKFVNEIIEFGAVKTDENLNVIDSFSMLITPQIGKKLNSHVEELTHITLEELTKTSNTFTHVLSKFVKFLGDSILFTWGTMDVLVLIENYKYYQSGETLPFLTKYCNLQKYCEKALDLHDPSKQMGLSTCAEYLGIDHQEIDLHRAKTDAMLSLECFKKLYDINMLRAESEITSAEFYRKINFRTHFINDINSPLVDKSQMYFNCDKCGTKAIQQNEWELKNRCFVAGFKCPQCSNSFVGRISFKHKYEGVSISKKICGIKQTNKDGKQES